MSEHGIREVARMTDGEWQTGTDPLTTFAVLRGPGFWTRFRRANRPGTTLTDRKMRLFLCGMSRAVASGLPERSRDVCAAHARLIEAHIDQFTRQDAEALSAERLAKLLFQQYETFSLASQNLSDEHLTVLERCSILSSASFDPSSPEDVIRARLARGSDSSLAVPVLRDLFPNPFRPVAFAAEWRTDTAVGLARKMYDAAEFGNLPVLASALQDAGCENADVLDHCRGPGPHFRGCWVVDLVLGND